MTGPLVVGRYALFDEIGAGGMATVQLGRLLGAVGFSRTVAVKRLHQAFASDSEQNAMLIDEARLAGLIHHPNVVSTLDVVANDAELLIVMEYVHGDSLARLVRHGPVPVGVAAAIVAGMLHGLHAAHETRTSDGRGLGIVHRDVSPHNVLVGVDGVARIADFGVAKAIGRIQTTRGGQRKGKLAYMAPEQLDGDGVDRRVDVYAAAVVFWEALTGRRLFAGGTDGETSLRVLSLDVEPPSRHVEAIPSELDEIVLRGLARDRNARFESARDMAVAIEDAVAIPPAHEVGEWVASVAAESLSSRSARLAAIQDLSTAGLGGSSASNLTLDTVPVLPRRSRGPWLLAVGGGLAIVITLLSWALIGAARPAPARLVTPATMVPNAPPSISTTVILDAPSAEPAGSTLPKRQPLPASKRPTLPPRPTDDCDPPFVLDSEGIKIPKRQCLRSP